jgi:ferredoxin
MTLTRKHALMIDASRCIGCHSCAVACKMEHELPAGPRTVKVIQIGPLEANGAPLMRYETVTCFHCDRPACVSACPTGAMQKRPDGLVFSEPSLCIGCQTCAVEPGHGQDRQVRRMPGARGSRPVAGLRAQVPHGLPELRRAHPGRAGPADARGRDHRPFDRRQIGVSACTD